VSEAIRLTPAAKLLGFLLLLALVFAGAHAAGGLLGPLNTGRSQVQYTGGATVSGSGGGSVSGSTTSGSTNNGMTGMPGMTP
jgi:hypothetical protein